MSAVSLLLGLWPGLNGLIRFGRGVFLILAAGFGFLASMTLFYCGFWTELISQQSKYCLTAGLGVSWFILTLVSCGLSRVFAGQLAYDENGDRYLMALDAYLAAHWSEAEKIAKAVLKRNKRDPEVLLLMASLCRHTGRFAEAAAYLDRLEPLETAEKWVWEIAAERTAIREDAAEAEDSSESEEPAIIPFPGTESADSDFSGQKKNVS